MIYTDDAQGHLIKRLMVTVTNIQMTTYVASAMLIGVFYGCWYVGTIELSDSVMTTALICVAIVSLVACINSVSVWLSCAYSDRSIATVAGLNNLNRAVNAVGACLLLIIVGCFPLACSLLLQYQLPPGTEIIIGVASIVVLTLSFIYLVPDPN